MFFHALTFAGSRGSCLNTKQQVVSEEMFENVDIYTTYTHTDNRGLPILFEPGHEKMCLMPYANKKGADQPAHPRSLISTFVVRCQDKMISLVFIFEISRFYQVSVAEQISLCRVWLETPEDTFSHGVAHIYI